MTAEQVSCSFIAMNATTSSILVLSLVSVHDSLTRKVLSTNVQKNLFKEGIKWADDSIELDHLTAPYLVVEGGKLYHSDPFECILALLTEDIAPQRFDITNDYAAFLEAVKAAKTTSVKDTQERTIDGVKVKITEKNVEFDPTDLLESIAQKAKAIQEEQFGQ